MLIQARDVRTALAKVAERGSLTLSETPPPRSGVGIVSYHVGGWSSFSPGEQKTLLNSCVQRGLLTVEYVEQDGGEMVLLWRLTEEGHAVHDHGAPVPPLPDSQADVVATASGSGRYSAYEAAQRAMGNAEVERGFY